MSTEETLTEKMQTLNVKPATKKAFRDLKWRIQRDLNLPEITDDEFIMELSKLTRLDRVERKDVIWYWIIDYPKIKEKH